MNEKIHNLRAETLEILRAEKRACVGRRRIEESG